MNLFKKKKPKHWKIKVPKNWHFKEWVEHETYYEIIYIDQYGIEHIYLKDKEN